MRFATKAGRMATGVHLLMMGLPGGNIYGSPTALAHSDALYENYMWVATRGADNAVGPRPSCMIIDIHLMAIILGCPEVLTGTWFSDRVYVLSCLQEETMVDCGFLR